MDLIQKYEGLSIGTIVVGIIYGVVYPLTLGVIGIVDMLYGIFILIYGGLIFAQLYSSNTSSDVNFLDTSRDVKKVIEKGILLAWVMFGVSLAFGIFMARLIFIVYSIVYNSNVNNLILLLQVPIPVILAIWSLVMLIITHKAGYNVFEVLGKIRPLPPPHPNP
ncbi:hypothetical protein DFR86_00380 [Acidianus sulfidivorans JP7]|uniref:Uncharacterized protein n=1 Tax=Acidianus sulfidivorans JP7 TaxID=619593 RepID=A0A2U9IJE4_9CREN|nr:hypothetical protein [Acidianus sulfidivorans]AWR96151.1 hypothetical protein DFR86_00380 [Acidianus sulfidivorans JP7]